jgi:hypothetical protein
VLLWVMPLMLPPLVLMLLMLLMPMREPVLPPAVLVKLPCCKSQLPSGAEHRLSKPKIRK